MVALVEALIRAGVINGFIVPLPSEVLASRSVSHAYVSGPPDGVELPDPSSTSVSPAQAGDEPTRKSICAVGRPQTSTRTDAVMLRFSASVTVTV